MHIRRRRGRIALVKSHELESLIGVLNSISNLCAIEHADRSRRLLRRAVEFLRYKHARRGQLLPLGDELEMVAVLFELARARFGEQLVASINRPEYPSESAGACFVPHYSVLAFVENGINHAFESIEPPWKLSVEVSSRESGFGVTIEDNGIGFEPEPYLNGYHARSEGDGGRDYTGLTATIDRLATCFGDRHNLRVASSPAAGTLVELHVPFG